MLAGTKIAAQDMVNAAAAALQDPAKPVVAKDNDNDTPAKKPEESEKSSPKALADSSAEKAQANLEEMKLEEIATDAVATSPEKDKLEPPKQEESNKENLSSGEKAAKPEAVAD